jgi:putative ABC transport system permease protein
MTPYHKICHAISFASSLAWYQLIAEKRRLAAALSGVSVAIIMMLMQLGLREALFGSGVLHYDQLQTDLAMISRQYVMLLQPGNFSRRRLYQALGQEGVDSVTPFYFSLATWKNPETLKDRNILVIGAEPQSRVFKSPEIQANLEKIEVPDVALFDRASRREFGPVERMLARDGKVKTEVAGRRLEISGAFTLGTSFGADGTIIVSDATFLRLFAHRPPGVIEMGLIKLKPGANIEAVRNALVAALPNDVMIVTRSELINLERKYWDDTTPIGFVLMMTLLFGMGVGAVVLYQILYSSVSDYLSEFATLKAIGYADWHLFLVVLFEAVILAVVAYPPSWMITIVIYKITNYATHLPIAMTWGRTAVIFILTVVMCSISGLLAMQKLRAADPAEVF